MINVLADKYLHNIRSYMPENINLDLYDPNEGFPSTLQGANAMLIRTVHNINKQTLADLPSSLRFIGTASAGSDHVDVDYLKNNGVSFSNAAGCNARSVAEYVATSLLLWSEAKGNNLSEYSVAIIGAGHVGTQVQKLLEDLGISYTLYDPPRELREDKFESAPINEVLKCDILTFHTPLTKTGSHPTYHWLDWEKLSGNSFELILNTARGGVIDESALLKAKHHGSVRDIIIDVWENEPEFSFKTADEAFIKTPHIAGYSEQAKSNATQIIVNIMLDHFDMPKPEQTISQHPRILAKDISAFDSFSELLTELHPIKKYESKLNRILQQFPDERGKQFNKLRAEFPLRQEFAQTHLPASYFEKYPVLKALGFSLFTADTK